MQEKTKKQIQNFKNGDKKAFDQIVVDHKDWVINMILSMVHNRQDAEDISQDVFVSVYFALDKFKGLSAFNTWLYRIVINSLKIMGQAADMTVSTEDAAIQLVYTGATYGWKLTQNL